MSHSSTAPAADAGGALEALIPHDPALHGHRAAHRLQAHGASPARRRDTAIAAPKPAFTWLERVRRDVPAGVVTGLMGIPLTIGICVMSEYPVQLGLATAALACTVSFAFSFWRPGNYVGVPGVAAGLAPVLAMGVHHFGMERMPYAIFLASMMQAFVWRRRLEGYILKAVPAFLVEGLLAGVGLKIALKFLPDTYDIADAAAGWFAPARLALMVLSAGAMVAFVWLGARYGKRSPGLPYIAVIGAGALLAQRVQVPMLHVEPVQLALALPIPDFATITPQMHAEIIGYAAMLMLIDVIEQVMSNAAIEKIDPLGRKSNSNNSLLVMWVGNALASLFGGMTNLDGLAKSSTNQMAGAVSKLSNLATALVFTLVLARPDALEALPRFALAVLMIYTGAKMVAGLYHVASHGRYGFGLGLVCALLVFRLGIFEGLLISLAVHSFIAYVVYRHEAMPTLDILHHLIARFAADSSGRHDAAALQRVKDPVGGVIFRSTPRIASAAKGLDEFIEGDWAHGVNSHNLLNVIGCYDVRGMLWGTFAKTLRSGHAEIKGYFEHLFSLEGVHVTFGHGETRQIGEIYIKSGAYEFRYHQRGEEVRVPARYSFVCKREATGWYVIEHHSSEFPA